jgi:hypothetical protein
MFKTLIKKELTRTLIFHDSYYYVFQCKMKWFELYIHSYDRYYKDTRRRKKLFTRKKR